MNGETLGAALAIMKGMPNNAAASAAAAQASADAAAATLASIPEDYTALSNEVGDLKSAYDLLLDEIPDTVQTITFDNATGNVSQIVHKKRTDSTVTVRTDVFTFGTNTITEVRTLGTGASLTIVTNTETLATTITYAAA